MKAGCCKHYSGIGLEVGPCEAGHNYLDVAAPLTQEQLNWHNENYKHQDPSMTAIIKRIPCFAENGVNTCPDFVAPTAEELAEQDKLITKMFTNMMTVRNQITDYIKLNKLPKSCVGRLPCPICEQGQVSWSRASNGHIHARCTTPKCVHWME